MTDNDKNSSQTEKSQVYLTELCHCEPDKKPHPYPLVCLPVSSSSGLSFLDSDDMSTMYHESFIIAQSGSAKGHMAMLDQSHAA